MLGQKDADGMTNCVDPENKTVLSQIRLRSSLICDSTVLFSDLSVSIFRYSTVQHFSILQQVLAVAAGLFLQLLIFTTTVSMYIP